MADNDLDISIISNVNYANKISKATEVATSITLIIQLAQNNSHLLQRKSSVSMRFVSSMLFIPQS